MKNIFIGLLVAMLCLSACSSNDSNDNIKRLGTKEFSKDVWAKASQEERGKMLFSLFQKHDVTKMQVEDIRLLLGLSTAYYEYDEFPAYLIGPESVKSDYGNGYLLAFPFDRETGKIIKYVLIPDTKPDSAK